MTARPCRRAPTAWAVAALLLCGCTPRGEGAPLDQSVPPGPHVTVGVDMARGTGMINEDLIGVNGPGPAGSFGDMKSIGVHWVRTDVDFGGSVDGHPLFDCATGAFDTSVLDARVSGIHTEGGTPLEIVDYSPACLSADPSSPDAGKSPPDIGANRQRWMSLVKATALHEIQSEAVRYFEVWNEPDWIFFSGGLSAYLQLYADTAEALEAAAGEAGVHIFVGGPALANVLDTMDTSWLDALLGTVSDQGLPLDFVSWHDYPNDPLAGPSKGLPAICLGRPAGPGTNLCYYNPSLDENLMAKEAVQARASLARYPALHPLLIIDEWNLDGEYDPRQSGPFDAAFAAAVLDSVQAAGVDGMSFFFVADSADDAFANWGMLDRALAPKPVYSAFSYWHRLAPRRRAVSLEPDQSAADQGGRVGAVASGDAGGRITVLLYDFKPYDAGGNYGDGSSTPYDHEVVLQIRGAGTKHYRVNVESTDGVHPSGATVARGSAGGPLIQVPIHLEGEGVALVTLTPLG